MLRKIFVGLLFTASLYGQIPAGYYDLAEGKSGNSLKHALHTIINDHVRYPYTSTSTDVWDILMYTDEDSTNTSNVILLYTGRSQAKSLNASQGSDPDYWNREHVWSKSHGFPNESDTAYTDAHHLRPADASVNSSRSNKDFDNGGTPHSEASGCYSDSDSWEPRDAVKGDVARMMFYMAVRYESDGDYDLELVETIPSSGPQFAKLATLLEWHHEDPVDAWERRRNDRVYSYQNNRNPFIDHPEYVDLIWGENGKAEPSVHVSSFYAVPNGLTVDLSWVDGGGEVIADYYLVRGSDIGYSSIAAPVDSQSYSDDSDFSDGEVTVSVPFGSNSYTFENLDPNTQYFFKIYSYSNGGIYSDYKTDGSIPADSATTDNGEGATELFISEYVEGTSYNKYLELYNGTAGTVDLSVYDIQIYFNGAVSPSTTIALSSNLAPGETYVIAHGSASAWGGTADLVTSALNFNGNDAVVLRKNSGDIDIVGIIGSSSTDYQDKTLRRKATVNAPLNSYNSTEWSEPGLEYSNLGTHNMDSPLPVFLHSFYARQQGGSVEVTWQTHSEIGNAGFRLWRAKAASSLFVLIADENQLISQGSSSMGAGYEFIDASPGDDSSYVYRLDAVGVDGAVDELAYTSVTINTALGKNPHQPRTSKLYANYPNPFNPQTTLRLFHAGNGHLRVQIFTGNGRLVSTLYNGTAREGEYSLQWSGTSDEGKAVSSGVYFCRMQSGSFEKTIRMLLLR